MIILVSEVEEFQVLILFEADSTVLRSSSWNSFPRRCRCPLQCQAPSLFLLSLGNWAQNWLHTFGGWWWWETLPMPQQCVPWHCRYPLQRPAWCNNSVPCCCCSCLRCSTRVLTHIPLAFLLETVHLQSFNSIWGNSFSLRYFLSSCELIRFPYHAYEDYRAHGNVGIHDLLGGAWTSRIFRASTIKAYAKHTLHRVVPGMLSGNVAVIISNGMTLHSNGGAHLLLRGWSYTCLWEPHIDFLGRMSSETMVARKKVNETFDWVASAIFIVFIGLRGSEDNVLWVGCKFVIFAVFVKTPCFGRRQKQALPKAHSFLRPQCSTCLDKASLMLIMELSQHKHS